MTEVKREMFGQMPQEDGGGVVKFILKSDSVKVEILSLGCIITALEMKGRDEEFSDVVLGSDTLEGRLGPWQGSLTPGAVGCPFGQPLGIFHHILPRAHHPPTGRTMEVHSTQPGIQFYTGNNLDGSLKGKGAVTYPRHSPHLPNTILWPDKEYNHTTWLVFSAA
uniref:Galactose mutarotase n=1 Tax=Athene cunicularia TaxID=194338 RepID=A0A663N3S4_ATHCN